MLIVGCGVDDGPVAPGAAVHRLGFSGRLLRSCAAGVAGLCDLVPIDGGQVSVTFGIVCPTSARTAQ